MAEPVRAIQTAEPIRLEIENISFKEGNLWRPRYESLIDYSAFEPEDGIQFEPAFLVYWTDPEQEVEIVFQIADSEPAVFDVLNGTLRWDLLAGSLPAPVATDRSCRVVWKRSAPLTALRIACRPETGWPPEPKKEWPDDWKLSWVHGGVYLVVIDPQAPLPALPESVNRAGASQAGTIRFLGIDGDHRPVYDLFKADAPLGLVMEPAFRARHGESRKLRLSLDDLVDPYAGVRFKVVDGQVETQLYPVVAELTSQVSTPVEQGDKACTVQWHRPADQTKGKVFNFNASLTDTGAANSVIRIDPTVIEPPACDAHGVCSPPYGDG